CARQSFPTRRSSDLIDCGMFAFSVSVMLLCAGGGSSVCTFTVFICCPVRSPMLNVAMISPFSPGFTTSFWVCVVVQPHDALTDRSEEHTSELQSLRH